MTLKIDDKFWDFVNVRMSVGLQVLILNGSLDVCVHSYTVGMDTTNDDNKFMNNIIIQAWAWIKSVKSFKTISSCTSECSRIRIWGTVHKWREQASDKLYYGRQNLTIRRYILWWKCNCTYVLNIWSISLESKLSPIFCISQNKFVYVDWPKTFHKNCFKNVEN